MKTRFVSLVGLVAVVALGNFACASSTSENDTEESEAALQARASELPLVRHRTNVAADVAARHLARLPESVKSAARCISVMSKDTIGWGLAGAGIGAGLVSCKTADGSWSSPSYT